MRHEAYEITFSLEIAHTDKVSFPIFVIYLRTGLIAGKNDILAINIEVTALFPEYFIGRSDIVL